MCIPIAAFAHVAAFNPNAIHRIAAEGGIQHTHIVDVVVIHGVVAIVGDFNIVQFKKAVVAFHTIICIVRHLTILRAILLTKNIKVPFTEERTVNNASTAFRLALKFLDIIHGKASKKAKYAHQLAWVYREAGDTVQEAEFMAKAAQFYEEALMRESFPIGAMTDNAVTYLIAAIYYRLGERQKATSFLSRLISDPSVREREPRILDKARDLWGDIRAGRRK